MARTEFLVRRAACHTYDACPRSHDPDLYHFPHPGLAGHVLAADRPGVFRQCVLYLFTAPVFHEPAQRTRRRGARRWGQYLPYLVANLLATVKAGPADGV